MVDIVNYAQERSMQSLTFNGRQLSRAGRLLLLSTLGTLLGGCAIATPFRGPGFAAGKVSGVDPGQTVVVALTNATVHSDRREPFDTHTRKVVDTLPAQPGLIGYSVRRELFGDEAWTMTVWRTDADRARFVATDAHRAAMAAGGPALKSVRFSRVEVPARDIPLSWDRAIQLLNEGGRRY
jgi:heme-degrading monooxygenase HmoA